MSYMLVDSLIQKRASMNLHRKKNLKTFLNDSSGIKNKAHFTFGRISWHLMKRMVSEAKFFLSMNMRIELKPKL